MELFDLKGKAAIVTGSTRGIGNAIAFRLAEHGANVVVCGRSVDGAREAAEAINRRGGAERAVGAAFDLTDDREIDPVIAAAVDHFGRLDILVCNAAQVTPGAFDTLDDPAMADCFTVNVVKNGRLASAAAAVMTRNGGGSIVFITSTLGILASVPLAAYSLAKAALHHFVPILALQHSPSNVRVNAIAPGIIQTDATKLMEQDREGFGKVMAQMPLRRIGQPDEVAGCVVFLASPAGAYATGHIFFIDGGQLVTGARYVRDT